MRRIGVMFVLLASLAAAGPLLAQPATGSIGGMVTASTGVGLPGATVTIRNPTAGVDRTVLTEADGTYEVADLPMQGAYEVQAELTDRKSTRLNSSHLKLSRMPSSA